MHRNLRRGAKSNLYIKRFNGTGRETCNEWEYTYSQGYLQEAKDPMDRIHTYTYDSCGRLLHEEVAGWERTYAYDPRGLLTFAKQKGSQSSSSWLASPFEEHSQVKRSYDEAGRLTLESIYLGSELIEEVTQTWGPSSRILQCNGHERELHYQNNRLIQVTTENVNLSYTYDVSGALEGKIGPYIQVETHYNPSGLPAEVSTQVSGSSHRETLKWNPSGRLSAYLAPKEKKQFTYTPRGHLQSAGSETYECDFGNIGTGVLTRGQTLQASCLDAFGKVTEEIKGQHSFAVCYNPMGEVVTRGKAQYEWDPWGRLLRVSDETLIWEASYDALGRRLQTRYTPKESATVVTTSFYDPEEEFQEIGVKYGEETYWKIFGPTSCDAIVDEHGNGVSLMHNALNQLLAVVTDQGAYHTPRICSSYGPQAEPSIPSDLISYAQSLLWHSKGMDPTGLILMGKRYYDPKGGTFISPDPVGFPICLNLYSYAGGDPINYFDPDGRFTSSVYQASKPILITGLDCLVGYRQKVKAFNEVSSFCYDHNLTRSDSYQIGSFDLPRGGIGFINGIHNTWAESMEKALQLSALARGARVYGIYNATNGLVFDVIGCGLGHIGCGTPPVQLLKNQWNHFIATHESDAKFLQICHSGGADHVKNALLTSPESTRQRIIALAIAPSVIIPKKLCYRANNYISRRDFVTHLDLFGKIEHGNELHILEPHPDANFWDHDFLSPTFERPIRRHIVEHIKNYGGIR